MPAPAPKPDPRIAAIEQLKKTRAEARAKRIEILKKIAEARKSAILAYVTSARGITGGQVSLDAIRRFREQLDKIGSPDKIDLLLITRGGQTLLPLRLMQLLREFAKKVSVLIPYMAHSAGTMIALGADEIVMGAMGELGPVDPSVTNQFNPILDPADNQGSGQQKPRPRIPISVEDVIAYLNFAKNHGKLDETGMADAYSALTGQVHPLALGNVLRYHNLIRHLARQLLLMHMDGQNEKEKVESIVKTITEELYAHDYMITREEALRIGLKSVKPSEDVERYMWEAYQLYESYLGIDRQVDLGAELGNEPQKYLCLDVVIVESINHHHAFSVKGFAVKKPQNNFEFNVETQGWES